MLKNTHSAHLHRSLLNTALPVSDFKSSTITVSSRLRLFKFNCLCLLVRTVFQINKGCPRFDIEFSYTCYISEVPYHKIFGIEYIRTWIYEVSRTLK